MIKKDLEERVHLVLLVGVFLSVAVMVAGIAIFVLHPVTDDAAIPVAEFPSKLLGLNPIAVIDLGIIMLIATPVIRIITVTVTMAQNRELMFVCVGIVVLVILFTSFVLA